MHQSQRISNWSQSLSLSVFQREYLFLITTVPSWIGLMGLVLNVVSQERTTISRSNGCCHGDSSCNNRSNRHHAEMKLLNKGKLEGEIIINGNCATTAPCYHCLRMLLLHIQKNSKSKFTLIYKLNDEFVKIKSTQLHTLLNSSVVSSGMRSHKRRC